MSSERPRDEPWIFRTYAGFASPAATNERFRANLARGQTGLSVAFDLPTQCGYDSDAELARGEVGRVGVPICHLGDMRTVFDGIRLDAMNTSMTINATAMWLLALYVALGEEQGVARAALEGTTQNDILKEFLSRGTHIFPPAPSLRLTTDLIEWTLREVPRWNPINVCSYHLQEAGAGPVLEVAFTLANAASVLDAARVSPRIGGDDFSRLVGRVSFFCNAGIRFVEEMCKMRAFVRLWDRLTRERYAVSDPALRRFRYGVQVNSLGLTPRQPENNVYRILLEMLSVTLSKGARARAIQLPAWNEALGLPRAFDQQWSLRAQQILALETDLLEHEDIFEGSGVVAELTDRIETEAWEELHRILEMGGSVEALGYMKGRLVKSLAIRMRRIESGEQPLVGVNAYEGSEESPLTARIGEGFEAVDRIERESERGQVERLDGWRRGRDDRRAGMWLDRLRRAAESDDNLTDVSLECARGGVTTGEWADALRDVFGEYRAPTGTENGRVAPAADTAALEETRRKVASAAARLGVERIRLLIAKPGLDGHSNAAEQVAVRARDAGMEVIYQGIRLTPSEIARAAADEDTHVIALSILSGAHGVLVTDVMRRLEAEGVPPSVPLVVGGVIPEEDERRLLEKGVSRVFTPRDHDLTRMVGELADLIR
ncbi:MAG: protein meaA [Actinobacteria bacterium]|nr:protein meaA [Actinomycetota bacterium]